MSKVAKFLLRPQVNLAGAALSALAEIASWFTAVDDAYRVTPLAFILCVVFLGLFALHEHLSAERLRSQARPTLKLVLQEGQLYDSLHVDETLRIFRVGIRSSGASAAEVAGKGPAPDPRRVLPGPLTRRFVPTMNGPRSPRGHVWRAAIPQEAPPDPRPGTGQPP